MRTQPPAGVDGRRIWRYRAWQLTTLLVLAAAVVAVLYVAGLFGHPRDWAGSAEGAVVLIGVFFVGAVPASAAFLALALGRRRPRLGALIASLIPLSLMLFVWGAGGSVREDPLLLVVIVPCVGYLALCASILAGAPARRQPVS